MCFNSCNVFIHVVCAFTYYKCGVSWLKTHISLIFQGVLCVCDLSQIHLLYLSLLMCKMEDHFPQGLVMIIDQQVHNQKCLPFKHKRVILQVLSSKMYFLVPHPEATGSLCLLFRVMYFQSQSVYWQHEEVYYQGDELCGLRSTVSDVRR